MEPATETVTASSSSIQPFSGVDVFSAIGSLLGNSEGVSGFFTKSGFFSLFNSIWLTFSIVAYIFSIILLVLYVYASVRRHLYSQLLTQELRDAERLYDEQYRGNHQNNRIQDVLNHSTSSNPNDWRQAVIEADIILDEALIQKGYVGTSLGERLRGITSNQLESLNDAWEAHKIRNRIAHDGSDFILTKRIAQETIVRYQRVFKELGII